MKKLFASLALFAALAPAAFAQSGADALLGTVSAGKAPSAGTEMPMNAEYKLNDPFLYQFFFVTQQENKMNYDVSMWTRKIFQGDYENAAHLWSALQTHFSESFAPHAKAAYLYCLWKMGVSQTFFDTWVNALSNQKFSQTKSALALEQVMAPDFNNWMEAQAIQISSEQEHTLKEFDATRSPLFLTFRAYQALRKGADGLAVLNQMPSQHPLKVTLAKTVSLGLAKKGDLTQAAQVLKRHLEPALVAKKDVSELTLHYLNVARLLYQAGAMEGAANYYEKIPTGTAEFLKAQEELAWVRLRQGDSTKLRGILASLSSEYLKDRFAPEVYLIRAISNLKFCFYQAVEKDFQEFLKSNSRWATEIEQALNSQDQKDPREKDMFTMRAMKALAKRDEELNKLKNIADRSISAVLPATGPQSHWTTAIQNMMSEKERAKKQVAYEFHRQWKNDKAALSEAIKKMQFVKVELLNQLQLLSESKLKLENGVEAKELQAKAKETMRAELNSKSATMSFPFDGVMWPDELFKLRSVTKGQCLGQLQGAK